MFVFSPTRTPLHLNANPSLTSDWCSLAVNGFPNTLIVIHFGKGVVFDNIELVVFMKLVISKMISPFLGAKNQITCTQGS